MLEATPAACGWTRQTDRHKSHSGSNSRASCRSVTGSPTPARLPGSRSCSRAKVTQPLESSWFFFFFLSPSLALFTFKEGQHCKGESACVTVTLISTDSSVKQNVPTARWLGTRSCWLLSLSSLPVSKVRVLGSVCGGEGEGEESPVLGFHTYLLAALCALKNTVSLGSSVLLSLGQAALWTIPGMRSPRGDTVPLSPAFLYHR